MHDSSANGWPVSIGIFIDGRPLTQAAVVGGAFAIAASVLTALAFRRMHGAEREVALATQLG